MSEWNNERGKSLRKIKIKPIELLKNDPQQVDTLGNAGEDVEDKLDQARDKLEQVIERKHQLIEETNTKIEEEKKNWQEEKLQWIETAKQDGYEKGFNEGKAESIELYRSTLEQANQIVDLIKIDYQKTLEKTDDVIVQIAIHTAEKILREKLKEEPEQFMHIVQTALKDIKNQSVISIYLHPANYELVIEQKAELKRILDNDTKLSIYINENLIENACIIEHPFGQIDAGVDTQLEQIRHALNELVMESENGT